MASAMDRRRKEVRRSEHRWISDIRDIAETDMGPDPQSRRSAGLQPCLDFGAQSARTQQFSLSAEWMLG
ncbi:hypothetical protein IVB22_39470 [Bradyrhizobium sp. 190]|uniref:hypothetical protein n=1 Tax=Bradyrhizobium sp. 190 TaxID=2782658 RepID=UPI001FF8BA10|nr:hypothetical protein [Bradyrhizobium sp. 190]MCK1518448.1 hypothetical protein [Bradyrhizobium sp. 190]